MVLFFPKKRDCTFLQIRMKWFEGGIAEAIAESRQKKALFVVNVQNPPGKFSISSLCFHFALLFCIINAVLLGTSLLFVLQPLE